jgi:hypoxanthine phosphoribosyltransferase
MVIGKPLFTAQQIEQRVRELADRISADYAGKEILAIAILKGAFMFFSDLVRFIKVPLEVDFITCSSYVKTESTGEVKIQCDQREDVRGKHVLLVEDIADTGVTLNYVKEHLMQKGPASVRICAFLDKKERRVAEVPLDYVGFSIPNQFMVGYGLDYDNRFRNLPYIAVFKKST